MFKSGDEVVLKSGSPVLTVEAVEADVIQCAWIDSEGVSRSDVFAADTLVMARPAQEQQQTPPESKPDTQVTESKSQEPAQTVHKVCRCVNACPGSICSKQ